MPSTRLWQALVAGGYAWFAAAALPWLAVTAPSRTETLLHGLPVLILVGGLAILSRAPALGLDRLHLDRTLAVAFPVSLGLAIAVREEAENQRALPGWTLLLCVLSLWGFVATMSFIRRPRSTVSAAQRPGARGDRDLWTRMAPAVVLAALSVAVVAPRMDSVAESTVTWTDAQNVRALLTTAAGITIAITMLITLFGPGTHRPLGSTRHRPWRRMVQPAILASLYAGAYLLSR